MPAPRAEQGMARIDHDPEEYEAPEVRLEKFLTKEFCRPYLPLIVSVLTPNVSL